MLSLVDLVERGLKMIRSCNRPITGARSQLSDYNFAGLLEQNTYILLDVLLCSIAEYFYQLCRILASP